MNEQSSPDNNNIAEHSAVASAWVLYALIVLEILFMVSPFAAFYYSAYATPLNLLQQWPSTAWLTTYLLPHFSYSRSGLVNGLLLVSWPLIGIGVALFVWAFSQIYYAKFRGRSEVASGMYSYVRHPQYLALALVGLGTSLFWSRYLVVLAFVSMLFVYGALARLEERRCLQRFPGYRDYLTRTGRFFPRAIERFLRRFAVPLPAHGWRRWAAIAVAYTALIGTTFLGCYALRGHALRSLVVDARPTQVSVFLVPFAEPTRRQIATLLEQTRINVADSRAIAYVAPASWQIPELGLLGDGAYGRTGWQELLHPTTHGNPIVVDETRVRVLITVPQLVDASAEGTRLLRNTLSVTPIATATIDLAANRVLSVEAASLGQWKGIPVPVF